MNWDNAIDEARDELGYSQYEYIHDWDEVVKTAKDILDVEKKTVYNDFCDDAHDTYQQYLKSKRWKELRSKILMRDNYTCCLCGNISSEVHHTNYESLGTDDEENDCEALCHTCHFDIHHKKDNKCATKIGMEADENEQKQKI